VDSNSKIELELIVEELSPTFTCALDMFAKHTINANMILLFIFIVFLFV